MDALNMREYKPMKIRSLVAVTLIASLLLTATGCNFKKSTFGPEQLAEYAEKSGANGYDDIDEWVEYHYDWPLMEDGIYLTFDGKDADDAIESESEAIFLREYNIENVTSGTFYRIGNRDKGCALQCVSFTFKSAKDAENFYSQWDKNMQIAAKFNEAVVLYDSSEEKGLCHNFIGCPGNIKAAYCQGKDVFVFQTFGPDDDTVYDFADTICEGLSIESPTSIL